MPFTPGDLDPRRSEIQHDVNQFRRLWQFAVYGRGHRVYPLRPARVRGPKGATALATKIALAGALLQFSRMFIVIDPAIMGRDIRLSIDFQGVCLRHNIDPIAAPACRFSANRTIAAHVGVRRVRQRSKPHPTAVTGPLNLHSTPPVGQNRCRLETGYQILPCTSINTCGAF